MSHFYGTVSGAGKTSATRRGFKDDGLKTIAASWNGAVRVTLYHLDGADFALVELIPWQGKGVRKTLYDGPVSGSPYTNIEDAAE